MTRPESEPEGFQSWAVLELMGHRQVAGEVREQRIASQDFLRVDVPEVPGRPAFTQFYGPQSVYAITPCTREMAEGFNRALPTETIIPFSFKLQAALPSPESDDHDGDDNG